MCSKEKARSLMVQGTASSVGKSVLVAALCRILRQDGWDVAPFKSQNMSLNSFVTRDGGEMGRAQVVQAAAACVEPTVDMNPILLKPEADNRSQVVIMGRPFRGLGAKEYYSRKGYLWSVVAESLDRLLDRYEVVVIEGAGSSVEVNLRDRDIVNMRMAQHDQTPVLLVADIDKGGVFASVVGTLELLEPDDRALVKAVVINKFRGDLSLLTPGLEWLEDRIGIPVAGVIPYYRDIYIAEEDSVSLERRRHMSTRDDYLLDIAVIGLPHISNFDDFDPLEREQGVRLRYVEDDDSLGDPDLIILPGTKTTIADLDWLKQHGLGAAIVAKREAGTPVVGICGGYQMLGRRISDPDGVESRRLEASGLGLLPVTTAFQGEKETHQVAASVVAGVGLMAECAGAELTGYEIHMGITTSDGQDSPFRVVRRSGESVQDSDGTIDRDGLTMGTYMHGLFRNRSLRRGVLMQLASWKGVSLPPASTETADDAEYDKLADLVRHHLDMDMVYRIAGLKG